MNWGCNSAAYKTLVRIVNDILQTFNRRQNMTDEKLIQEFQAIEDAFNDAFVSNKVEEISRFLSSDWFLLEPQFGVINKKRFLNNVEIGNLSHTTMRKKVLQVKLYNDIALVTNRGMNIGFYRDNPFNSEQWVTNVYKKENENWICVMTQEAPVTCK